MANDKNLSPRTLRLKEMYDEMGYASVVDFARDAGVRQSTISNYFNGFRDPSDDVIYTICGHFPQYSARWIRSGLGEKYSDQYVEQQQSVPTKPEPAAPAAAEPERPTASGDAEMMERITHLIDRLVTMSEQLTYWQTRCMELEKELRSR